MRHLSDKELARAIDREHKHLKLVAGNREAMNRVYKRLSPLVMEKARREDYKALPR